MYANDMIRRIKRKQGIRKLICPDLKLLKKGSNFKTSELSRVNKYRRYFVYKITNPKTGRFYIGQTHDVVRRVKTHMTNKDICQKHRLGDPKSWVVRILEAVSYKEPVIPACAYSILEKEQAHILKAKSRSGRKCVNKQYVGEGHTGCNF